MDLECQITDRTTIGAIGHHQLRPVSRQQRKNPVDWVIHAFPIGFEQPFFYPVAIIFQHPDQHILFPGEEMIQTAAVHLTAAQNIGN